VFPAAKQACTEYEGEGRGRRGGEKKRRVEKEERQREEREEREERREYLESSGIIASIIPIRAIHKRGKKRQGSANPLSRAPARI
jgi:hypothetical protein